MRHKKQHRKLSRTSAHRRAMFRNMSTSLLEAESILTTVQKAKEIRPIVEKLVTLGKNDELAAKRKAYSYLKDKAIVHKLFHDIGPRYIEKPGGYLRITRVDNRKGDNAEMAVIEFV